VVLADGTQVVIKVKAIGQADYDAMLAAHPPTAAQKKDDGTFDIDTFGPALGSRPVRSTPSCGGPGHGDLDLTGLEPGEADPPVSPGVIAVNNARLDVPFSATG